MKITMIDKGQCFKVMALQVDEVLREMQRRKVRFLPAQVTRRIIAGVTISPFKFSA